MSPFLQSKTGAGKVWECNYILQKQVVDIPIKNTKLLSLSLDTGIAIMCEEILVVRVLLSQQRGQTTAAKCGTH